jgi:hypothetical protein
VEFPGSGIGIEQFALIVHAWRTVVGGGS